MEAGMRGSDAATGSMFSYVDLEARVPANHPLRVSRDVVNEVLVALDPEFAKMYAAFGRPSVPHEMLLRRSLIQAFYPVRSERQLMEQLDYNLLFRWFVGLGVDDPVWDHSTYSKNRDRLLDADVAKKFLKAILAHLRVAPLLSDDHFTVDGTLVQAWASMKSFLPKDGAAPGSPPEAAGPPSATELPAEGVSSAAERDPPPAPETVAAAQISPTPETTEAVLMNIDTADDTTKSRNAAL